MRAVIFDVGGVLVTNPLAEFTKVDTEFDLPAGTVMALFRGGHLFAECEIGRLSFAEFCSRSVADLRAQHDVVVPPERLEAMMDAIMGPDSVRPGMRDLAYEIKSLGLRVGLLTNIYRELDGWLRALFAPGVLDIFCPSYLAGVRKPDPEIYRQLVAQAGLRPDQMIFIDDFPENVVAAERAGLTALLFSDEKGLREQLRALGVPVAEVAYLDGARTR